jgi:hypothetical protein
VSVFVDDCRHHNGLCTVNAWKDKTAYSRFTGTARNGSRRYYAPIAQQPGSAQGAYISSCSKFHLVRTLSCPLPPALGALAFVALFAPLLPVDRRAG